MLFKEKLSIPEIPFKIKRYLDLNLHSSATFLAERFHAHVKTQESLHLLATCYHRQNGPEDACVLLVGAAPLSLQNKYLLAVCAYESKKTELSEKCLLQLIKDYARQSSKLSHSVESEYIAAAHTLLGNIHREKSNAKGARANYIASLRMDALSWTPFQQLCDMGYDVEHCIRSNNVVHDNTLGKQIDKHSGFAKNNNPLGVQNSASQKDAKTNAMIIGTDQNDENIMKYLSCIARGYNELSIFQCREAVRLFKSLPKEQLNTPFVLTLVAKSYFELTEYKLAKDYYCKLSITELLRNNGMAMYSTVLWLLKDEVKLSYLARGVIDCGKMTPESWCVIGNCFSLQKEHETAISFFQRSIQLDKTYAYAYTLSGHEFVSNEDFDKALDCYRRAIQIEPRHYNAWYGLGIIYFRQEKYKLSYFHFNRALSINPNSSVLLCYIGMVISQMGEGNTSQAMVAFEKAALMEPRNPQARYQRALLLVKLKRLDEALQELYLVRDFAPSEASISFEIGKVYMQLNHYDKARLNFNAAHDLDPKNGNMYKSYLDKLNEVILLP
jgi:anaphase-promoting complex subunit 3